uniref:Si:dkey-29d8.3 n=1 Tax=Paramormyrops kingsleyae TaxID=1676925 RepID=A0A3B3RXQ7_9TELE
PFSQSTGNVSAQYDTEITPAGWTFSIWGVIYAWLSAMLIYILTGFCRTSYDWMYCSPAVLPYAFFLSCMLNMSLNVTWLFLWDRQMIAAVIVLALIAFTSYLMILFSCHVLYLYGAWLHLQHPADLWLVRVLQVQNGIGLYATWTTVATLLNFTVALQHNAGVSKYDAATVALVQLLVEVILVLETHLRYLLIIYPVVILALIGSLTKDYDVVSPSRNNIFT